MARLIVRIAFVAAAVGLATSIIGHVLSLHSDWKMAPAWFIAAFMGIFPVSLGAMYVCRRLWSEYGVVGADRQWAFFHERSPKWLKAVRTGLFVYALARFGWFAVLDASGSAADEGPPLGLFSAFGMVIYLTVAMVLRVALKDARLVPHSAESS